MKRIAMFLTALVLVLTLAGCKTRGSSEENNESTSQSDNSDSEISIKTGKKDIGKVSDNTEKELTRDVQIEANIDDNINLSSIVLANEDDDDSFKKVSIKDTNIKLADFIKTAGLKDRKLKNREMKSKGFLFEGKGYIGPLNDSVLFVEEKDDKVKAICLTWEYTGNDFNMFICDGICVGTPRDEVVRQLGYGTAMEDAPKSVDSVVYYKNSKNTLVLVYEKVNNRIAVTEMTLINNKV